MTAWFVVSVVSGFVLVFFAHEFVQEVVLLGPSLIVAVYAVVVWRGVRNSVDAEFQEHHIDSVYFLGFLFTLISLFSLFASYAGIGRAGLVKPNIDDVFFYVGIAVTTSLRVNIDDASTEEKESSDAIQFRNEGSDTETCSAAS